MDIVDKIYNYINESKKDSLSDKFDKAFWWDKSITDPKKLQKRVREMSDKDLMSLKGKDGEEAKGKSPRDLQIKIIAQEIKRRGLK